MDFKTGGQQVITRILDAYGFKTRQALCDHLGISTSTMGTRWMRDIFPADWVIQCSIETGVSVEWLSFGKEKEFPKRKSHYDAIIESSANENALGDVLAIPRKKIVDGNVYDSNFFMLDKAILPQTLHTPVIIWDENLTYLADQTFDEIIDGTWMVEIENKISIRNLTRVPVRKIQVSNTNTSFECDVNDINVLAKCKFILLQKI